MISARALLLVGLAAASARAATVTVAVMPFKDLSGGSGSIGEAIRETVTTDLKELSGVRVIERGNLDKILAEQNLQGQRADLDPSTAAKVGKLLGANLICGGAYQKARPKVRLTARFVKVETGEIVDTAKVDGDERDFLHLQDKITALLLKRAGLTHHAQKFEQRARPPLKNLNTMELYGQALVADNDDLKRKYLQLAVAEDGTFSYAVNDLASLEKRMKVYESNADVARDQKVRDAHSQMSNEADPNRWFGLMNQVFMGLQQSHRYRQMAVEAHQILQSPPHFSTPAAAGVPAPEEMAGLWLVTAEQQLGDTDAVLRDGERFLRKFPASMYFQSIKMQMDSVINEKHRVDEARGRLAAELADIPDALKGDPCKLGFVYNQASEYQRAREYLRTCMQRGDFHIFKPGFVLQQMIEADLKLHDFANARRDIAALEQADPAFYRNIKISYEMRLPADG